MTNPQDKKNDDEITDEQLAEERRKIHKAESDELSLYAIHHVFNNEFTKEVLKEGVEDLESYLDQYFQDFITKCNDDNNKKDPAHFPIMDEETKKRVSSILSRFLINEYGNFEGEDPFAIDPLAPTKRAEKLVKELETSGITKQEVYYALYAVQSLSPDRSANNTTFDAMLQADEIALQTLIVTLPDTQIVSSSPTLSGQHISGKAGAHRKGP